MEGLPCSPLHPTASPARLPAEALPCMQEPRPWTRLEPLTLVQPRTLATQRVRFHPPPRTEVHHWRDIQGLSASGANSRTSWLWRSRRRGVLAFRPRRQKLSSSKSLRLAHEAPNRSVRTWHPAQRRVLLVQVASPSHPRNRRDHAGTDSCDDSKLRAPCACVSARSTTPSQRPPPGALRPPAQMPLTFVPISPRSTSPPAQVAPVLKSASESASRPAACTRETSQSWRVSSVASFRPRWCAPRQDTRVAYGRSTSCRSTGKSLGPNVRPF
jgi:hypothetical protein